ncbi:DUF3050 domain-containing protein [Sediminibacterium ginsengisoli]|uniref:DUF3050 domain-containing protein n=1 Tax=Sediminibacterium ginsengisoli TaxID=413434 RepID=A0A1T4MED8_9BACT|nr:DUF3050 domain-containing protein [Sediminibacterium ginsengisoli]SJZ65114.1 Protein of unknown function [Sediminibacterium ginsengisoli]
MNNRIEQLKQQIEPARQKLVAHPLYTQFQDIEQLKTFSEWHVFAVWDFMSLLKSLQVQLTCAQSPWVPVGNANTCFLINEIVLGEESDVDESGNRTSHFELYLKAMQEMGADTSLINKLVTELRKGSSVYDAFNNTDLPEPVRDFIGHTFHVIEKEPVHVQAAVFTFGREDLIPDMFIGIVRELSSLHAGQLNTFRYYLERHIEVDGEHHSHLAMEMVSDLCGNDPVKWEEAANAAILALEQRHALWNGVLNAIRL